MLAARHDDDDDYRVKQFITMCISPKVNALKKLDLELVCIQCRSQYVTHYVMEIPSR